MGKNAVVAAIGINSVVKAKVGSWIVLAEYNDDNIPICVKSERVDGEKIKPDTWYALKGGEFVEVED